jgi:hypothetical protein
MLLVVLALVTLGPNARAADKADKSAKVANPRKSSPPAEASEPAPREPKEPKEKKARVYTFGALDVEGKLKTPQLLYFLNRVKLELDTTSPPKRSFIPELEKSSDAKGL